VLVIARLIGLILCAAICCAEGRWEIAIATAYCPCAICCGRSADGITATGTSCASHPHGIAIDPARIAYGTRILIPHGYGYLDQSRGADRWFIADDTGAAMRTATTLRIDLRYRTHASAVQFGVRVIPIWIE
jgi:3D (Asp-Asp-Asp) domain-containing protein